MKLIRDPPETGNSHLQPKSFSMTALRTEGDPKQGEMDQPSSRLKARVSAQAHQAPARLFVDRGDEKRRATEALAISRQWDPDIGATVSQPE
jgi:hypothetical protein